VAAIWPGNPKEYLKKIKAKYRAKRINTAYILIYIYLYNKRILKTQQENYLFHSNMWLINYTRKSPWLGGDF
jgi:hypothetical protein